MKRYNKILQSILSNKANRKLATLVLILVGLTAVSAALYITQDRSTRAAGLVTMTLQVPSTAKVGDTVNVPILINDPGLGAAEYVSAAEIHVSVPANLVEVISIDKPATAPYLKEYLGGTGKIDKTAGTASIILGAGTDSTQYKKGSGIVAVLQVKTLAQGSAPIQFGTKTQVAATGHTGNVTTAQDLTNGTVTISTAQSTTGASLNFGTPPSPITVNTNFTIPVVMNTNGKATDAVNAVIEFDSTKLQFVSAAKGTAFDTYNQNGLEPGTGTLRQVIFEALMQVDNGTGISGSAVSIGTITFKPLAAGSTTLKILCSDATGANCDPLNETYSQISQYEVEGEGILTSAGRVTLTVVAASSPTPTPTTAVGVTNTPTPTRTPTPTPTRTPTPTPSLAPKQLGFTLKLSGSGATAIPASFSRPMKVTINSSPAISLTMTGSAIPNITIPQSGNVTVTLQPEGYLPVTLTISNPAALSGTVDLSSLVTFIGGNAVEDGRAIVDSVDFVAFRNELIAESSNVASDFNSSGKVTVLDYSSFLNNIQKQGLSITLN